ncbi:hypothetical protein OUZ56_023021 [Daphnia magna]|uniref:Uncharacterized protein n=1 Tax=Daphnia magna TaxID=35525 RepID=A0ABR0AY44_9CRUS|nr:hypothetical protein OUZ56_023021 [Daphnia magna]
MKKIQEKDVLVSRCAPNAGNIEKLKLVGNPLFKFWFDFANKMRNESLSHSTSVDLTHPKKGETRVMSWARSPKRDPYLGTRGFKRTLQADPTRPVWCKKTKIQQKKSSLH